MPRSPWSSIRAITAVLLDELAANQGATDTAMRRMLAAKAFAHTAQYDAMVSAYFTGVIGGRVADLSRTT